MPPEYEEVEIRGILENNERIDQVTIVNKSPALCGACFFIAISSFLFPPPLPVRVPVIPRAVSRVRYARETSSRSSRTSRGPISNTRESPPSPLRHPRSSLSKCDGYVTVDRTYRSDGDVQDICRFREPRRERLTHRKRPVMEKIGGPIVMACMRVRYIT